MRRCFLIGAMAAAWLSLLATAQAGAPAKDPVARGEAVYTTYCIACHGADGKGPIGANFIEDKTRLAKSDEELLKTIREGITGTVGAMPPWGAVLKEEQQREVLAYVRAKFGSS